MVFNRGNHVSSVSFFGRAVDRANAGGVAEMSAHLATPDMLMASLKEVQATLMLLCRMQGAMLTRRQMLERYDVCNKTLNARVARGTLPKPGADGKWLLSEVMEFESAQPLGNV